MFLVSWYLEKIDCNACNACNPVADDFLVMNIYLACVFHPIKACGGNVVLLRTSDTKCTVFGFGRLYKGKMLEVYICNGCNAGNDIPASKWS